MAFPKTRSHIIALFVDHGLTEGQAFSLSRHCCKDDSDFSVFDGSDVPDKKTVKLAIQTRGDMQPLSTGQPERKAA